MLQLTFQDITHADDLEIDLATMRRFLAGEISSYSSEKRYLRKDRSPVWVHLTASLVRAAGGEPQFFIAVVNDITDRKRGENELQRSEALWEAGADLAGIGFYEVDFLERRAFLDDRILSIWGVPPERGDGLGPVEFWMENLHPDDRAHVLEADVFEPPRREVRKGPFAAFPSWRFTLFFHAD